MKAIKILMEKLKVGDKNPLEKLIKDYAHDYRDMAMREADLAEVLTAFLEEIKKICNPS